MNTTDYAQISSSNIRFLLTKNPCSHPGTTFSLRLKSKKGEMGYIARGILSPNLIRSCPAVNAQFWSGCVHFLEMFITAR